MAILEAVKQALLNLGSHKLRTLLTMLGMIFGVAAVLSMLAIGAGAEREALSVIEQMGLRNIVVQAKTFEREQLQILRQDSPGLTRLDAVKLRQALPESSLVVGKKFLRPYQISSEMGRADSRVVGVEARFPHTGAYALVEGSFFLPIDEEQGNQVCVLGAAARRKLFGLEPAIGRQIKINQEWFTVIGILLEGDVGGRDFEGVRIEDTSNDIYVPLRTLLSRFERDPVENELDEIIVRIPEGHSLQQQAGLISSLMAGMHNQIDDFSLVVPQRLLEQSRRTQQIFNIVMGAIASISLLVGGIGIMNIMLASVLERTSEIGLRRAIGARRRDITFQFVLEAVAISSAGAALGIGLGFALAETVSFYSGWSTLVTPFALILSVSVSVTVGILFGIYPARRAALVSPIEALRYE